MQEPSVAQAPSSRSQSRIVEKTKGGNHWKDKVDRCFKDTWPLVHPNHPWQPWPPWPPWPSWQPRPPWPWPKRVLNNWCWGSFATFATLVLRKQHGGRVPVSCPVDWPTKTSCHCQSQTNTFNYICYCSLQFIIDYCKSQLIDDVNDRGGNSNCHILVKLNQE